MSRRHLDPNLTGICKYHRIALIEKGSVVPGNPDVSELYTRLIITETAKRMPLGQPQLPT